MRVKVHQDIEGVKSGESVDVPEGRAKWLLAEGYASTSSTESHSVGPMSVEADLDPRRADNVKDKPNTSLDEQLAAGLGLPGEPDPDPVPRAAVEFPTPVEATNVKGNPEKAEKGKQALAERAVKVTEDEGVVASEETVA